MAVTVQMQCESVVPEMSADAFSGSSIDNGTTIIQGDLRQLDLQRVWETTATICWCQAPSAVEVHALSTIHKPSTYRFLVAQGASLHDQHQRVSVTPDLQGVSTSQPMSPSVIRLACDRAGVCGGRPRHLALLCPALFLMPLPTSSSTRWMEAMGAPVPTPEARLRQWRAIAPATECHMDGDDPLGTDHGGMVVKDAHDRIRMTHAAPSEHGDEARQLLQRGTALGLPVTAACSDASHSCPAAITAVDPPARVQADHCHTVTHSWGHLTKALLASRRQVQASGEAQQHEASMAVAQPLWTWRWSLLTKPSNLSGEDKQAMTALARAEAGCVHRFRRMSRQLVPLFDHAPSAAPATRRLQQLRTDSHAREAPHLAKIPPCFDAHWEQAVRSLRKKGMGKHRRGSHSESGMRLLRRLEKNHAGIRSAATRQPSIQR